MDTAPEFQLCSSCSQVDFNLVFSGKKTETIYVWQLVPPAVSSETCSLCSFLLKCLPMSVRYLFADPGIDPVLYLLTPNTCGTGVGILRLKLFSSLGDYLFEIGPIACIASCPQRGFPANLPLRAGGQPEMVPPLVSYTTITHWISQAYDQSEPQNNSVPQSKETSPLTVIDCTTRDLVLLPKNESYVTLSYVWGTVNADQSTKLSRLPLRLPNTIEDSITFCRGTNFRYLWVDRYCIRGSHDIRAQQIKQMDKIYSESALTIIACAGSDSSYGLPGVSRPRIPDPSIQINNLGYLRAIPAMYDIERSIWATRGWTYQEALLSKRQLYFTDKQLFLGSHENIESETVVRRRDWVSETVSDVSKSKYSLGWSRVYGCIQEYSKRQLSYPEDILNALLGILSKFQKTRRVFHLWGVPFGGSNSFLTQGSIHSREFTFQQSLCWSIDEQVPRKGFPTWSWTSRVGTVRWPIEFPLILEDVPSNSAMAPKFEVELRSGRICSLSEYQLHYDNLNNYGEGIFTQDSPSRFIHVEAFVSQIINIEDPAISDRVTLKSTTDKPIFMEVDGNEILAPGPPGSVVVVHLITRGYNCGQTYYALIVRNMGDHWERAGLIRDVEHRLDMAFKVRRKLRLG